MTVTIEVKPETVHRWREIAEREGRNVESVAAQAAEAGTDEVEAARDHADRCMLIASTRGKYAGRGQTVNQLMQERSERDRL